MQSAAPNADAYLAELPPDRRTAIAAVRQVILKNLAKGFVEGMQYGMIAYSVPHSLYPPGYHCDPALPLPFAGLASQKQYMALYLGGTYCGCGDDGPEHADATWLHTALKKAGPRLDIGKACIRFKKLEDLPLEIVGQAITRVSVREFIERYESVIKPKGKPVAKRKAKPAGKRTPKR